MALTFDTISSVSGLNDADKLLIGQSDADRAALLTDLISYIESKPLSFSSNITTVDVLPEMTGAVGNVSTRSIGSSAERFANVWANEVHIGASSLYINGKEVIADISDVITFQTGTDQAILLKTVSSTPGTGNANLTFQSGNEINVTGIGGIEFTVPATAAGKSLTFSNSSSGGNIQFNGTTVSNGNLSVTGNFTVSGTTTEVDTTTVNIQDNLIQINSNQTGDPPTTLVGGIEVNRGDSLNYRFIFQELTDTFRVGENGSEQAVATREDSPSNQGVPYWNDTAKRMDTSSDLTFDGSDLKVLSQRVVTVTSGTSFPGSPALGDECYRTDSDGWFKYNGTAWTQI